MKATKVTEEIKNYHEIIDGKIFEYDIPALYVYISENQLEDFWFETKMARKEINKREDTSSR